MTGDRRALIVAVDDYADAGLRRLIAPARDATALAEALGAPGVGDFTVDVVRNGTAQEIRVSVEDFFADARPDDLLLLHFSGHGLKNAGGELFLAAADSRPERLASTAVAADFVNRQMAESRAQRIALFLDCCYGGAFPRGMVVRGAGDVQVREAFAETERSSGGRGRVVVTASSAVEYAFEGAELTPGALPEPSVFTGALVRGLTTGDADRDGDGWVGLHELFGYVTDEVRRSTPHQTPHLWAFGSDGELLIAHSRRRRISPVPPASELVEATSSPLSATRLGVALELAEIAHGRDLPQALGAWELLNRMRGDDSQRVRDAVTTALGSLTPAVEPSTLELVAATPDGPADGVVRLAGPPLATTATATTDAPWLHLQTDGPEIRISAEPGDARGATATVLVSTPVGEVTVDVTVRTDQKRRRPRTAPTAVVATPPTMATTPAVATTPATATPPAAATAPTVAQRVVDAPTPAATSSTAGAHPPIWAVAGVVLATIVICISCSKLMYDWGGQATFAIVAAIAAVIPLVRPTLTPVALGVAGGGLLAYVSPNLYLLATYTDSEDRTSWKITAAAAAVGVGFVAAGAARARVFGGPAALRRIPPFALVALALGAATTFYPYFWTPPDGQSNVDAAPWSLIDPFLIVAVTAAAVALRTGPAADRFVAATAYAYVAARTFSAVSWEIWSGHWFGVDILTLAGAALLAAAVLLSHQEVLVKTRPARR